MDDDDDYVWDGVHNAFKFGPAIPHGKLLQICDFSESLGYKIFQRDVGYTLAEVQERLRERGPGSFLNIFHVQEDISPKAPPPTTEQFVIERLARLKPANELLVIDRFMFARVRDVDAYADRVARIVDAALGSAALVRFVSSATQTVLEVRAAVELALKDLRPSVGFEVHDSDDFHDRFWLADRERGAVVGTSFNGLGGRIFLMDELSRGDVEVLVREVSDRGVAPPP